MEGFARIALSVDDRPFTRLRLFDRDHGHFLNQVLHDEFPWRDFEVFADDCNLKLPTALHELRSLSWAPTFARLFANSVTGSRYSTVGDQMSVGAFVSDQVWAGRPRDSSASGP